MRYKIDFHPSHLELGWDSFKALFPHIEESYLKEVWEKKNGKIKKVKKASN